MRLTSAACATTNPAMNCGVAPKAGTDTTRPKVWRGGRDIGRDAIAEACCRRRWPPRTRR